MTRQLTRRQFTAGVHRERWAPIIKSSGIRMDS
jgi:hypothetical protein